MVGCASPVSVRHHYELSVVDIDDKQLEGVKIDYELQDLSTPVIRSSYTTLPDGTLTVSLNTMGHVTMNRALNSSTFIFKVSKQGYFPKNGRLTTTEIDNQRKPAKTEIVTLIKAGDYYDKDYLKILGKSDVLFLAKTLIFIWTVVDLNLTPESTLQIGSVKASKFKGNKYLQFTFIHNNVFNTLKLSKHDVGTILFTEAVRDTLIPLSENIGDSKMFYGYEFKVIGYMKNFAYEYETAKPIEYSFLIPANVINKYKNRDITGQQVLDASTILMENQRIELKLQ